MVTTKDGAWGVPFPNGTVNGMIGMVYRREAHFAACELTISDTREAIIDFTYPYYIEIFTLVSPAPKEKGKTFAVFSSFTNEVWICIASLTFAVGLLLFVMTRSTTTYLHEKLKGYTLENLLFNVYRTSYSSMLIATLVKPSFEKPIESLSDIPAAVRNGFTFAIPAGGLTEEMFKIISDRMIITRAQTVATYTVMQKGARLYHIAKEPITSDSYGIACFAGAPFRNKFSKKREIWDPLLWLPLSHMVESGLIRKWANNEFMKVAGKSPIEASGLKPFTLEQLQAAFYIILIGYMASALALGIELISTIKLTSQ
ncbi:glutamate receptor ionotropic, delta-1-like [Palaemon carinicauda]|uniref:glutamate receptor ionotropic, delta-1-like n=1 Tax=Palaemon carinicauda TaxID=392227 RepID=UPI0035B63002